MSFRTGEIVSHYRILTRLGAGGHIFHGDEIAPQTFMLCLIDFVDGGDVRMIEGRCRPGFAQKPVTRFLIEPAAGIAAQQLEGDE